MYNKHIDLVISRSHAAKMDWVDPTAQHMAVRHSTYDLPFSAFLSSTAKTDNTRRSMYTIGPSLDADVHCV